MCMCVTVYFNADAEAFIKPHRPGDIHSHTHTYILSHSFNSPSLAGEETNSHSLTHTHA